MPGRRIRRKEMGNPGPGPHVGEHRASQPGGPGRREAGAHDQDHSRATQSRMRQRPDQQLVKACGSGAGALKTTSVLQVQDPGTSLH